MYHKGEVLTLENDTEYFVIEAINYNSNNYLYLANTKDKDDYALVKETEEGLQNILDDEEYEKVLLLIIEKNKDKIQELLEN